MKKLMNIFRILLFSMCIAMCTEKTMTVYAATQNISSISFEVTDIRNSQNTTTFDGSDGKYSIILYGGIGSCGNTNSVMQSLEDIAATADMSELNIYAFDIKSNAKDDIVSALSDMDISTNICVSSACTDTDYKSLYYKCMSVAEISGTWTLPLVAYKNPDGEIYAATTAYTDKWEIIDNLNAGGLDIELESDTMELHVSGISNFDISYKILDIVNEQRSQNGIPALQMDRDLLSASMLRAAECSLLYSSGHLRPTGEACFSVHQKVSGENIAYISGGLSGFSSDELAELVMDMWMNSTGHRANILNTSYTTIGVGCFYVNNTMYFSQNFGRNTVDTAAKNTSANATIYKLSASPNYVQQEMDSNILLNVGETATINIKAYQGNHLATPILPDSYHWSSDSSCAKVDNGIVQGISSGSATITAINKLNPDIQFQCEVNVSGTQSDTSEPSVDTPPSSGTVYDGIDYAAVFNAEYYYNNNSDVAKSFGNNASILLKHFVTSGMDEGRQASSDFNVEAYKNNNPDIAAALGNNTKEYYLHYINHGKAEGRDAVTMNNSNQIPNSTTDYSAVFNAEYYYNNNPDTAAALGKNENTLLQHFVANGMDEGRQASAEFNIEAYKNNNPDVVAALGNNTKEYYLHYINHGKAEGRSAVSANSGNQSSGSVTDYSAVFNAEYYYNNNPDVAGALGNDADSLLKHFIANGMDEGRQASAEFNVNAYKNNNPDVVAALGDNTKEYYLHYINHGKAEGRNASTVNDGNQSSDSVTDYSAVFNAEYYYNNNPDVAAALGNNADTLLQHFVNNGMNEGRQACSTFNVNVYKNCNADLVAAFGGNLKEYYMHYIKCGISEGRTAY